MLNFSTWMVVKIFFHNYPIPFILTGMAFLLSFTSYGMYIYERYTSLPPISQHPLTRESRAVHAAQHTHTHTHKQGGRGKVHVWHFRLCTLHGGCAPRNPI
jgi:hypothetical protein